MPGPPALTEGLAHHPVAEGTVGAETTADVSRGRERRGPDQDADPVTDKMNGKTRP